jgi:hypothetical protein
MAICATCGKENREKARFCSGCARPLVALTPDSGSKAPEEAEPIEVKSGAFGGMDTEPVGRQPLNVWRWIALCSVVVVLLAVGLSRWKESAYALPPSAAAPTANVSTPDFSAAQQVAPAPSFPKETFLDPGHTEVVLEDRLQKMDAGEREKSMEERAAQREKMARANAARAIQRQETEEARQAAGQPNPASPDLVGASPAPSAAAPNPDVSVEKACSQATNFLSRDLCRIEACRKPSKAGDPICVWYRQLEAERKHQTTF